MNGAHTQRPCFFVFVFLTYIAVLAHWLFRKNPTKIFILKKLLFGLEKKAFIFITVKGFCIYLILLTRIFLVFFSDSRGLFNGASAHAKRYLKREIVLTLTCYTFYFLTFIFGMLYIAALRPR